MGYTTDFEGAFKFKKPLIAKMQKYLKMFNETRRMKRKQDEVFGTEGEFFVFGSGDYGQGHDKDIVDHNTPPKTQPGLWCQWTPSDDGTELEWDGGEKFYYYTDWLFYLVNKIIKPNGYVLNGEVTYSGEEQGDTGDITIEDNVIFVDGHMFEEPIKSVTNYDTWKTTQLKNYMELDKVLLLDNVDKLIENK